MGTSGTEDTEDVKLSLMDSVLPAKRSGPNIHKKWFDIRFLKLNGKYKIVFINHLHDSTEKKFF